MQLDDFNRPTDLLRLKCFLFHGVFPLKLLPWGITVYEHIVTK